MGQVGRVEAALAHTPLPLGEGPGVREAACGSVLPYPNPSPEGRGASWRSFVAAL